MKKYIDGTTFEDIVALYEFDENLRELFLKYLLKIEQNMRSQLSYYFTGNDLMRYLRVLPKFEMYALTAKDYIHISL